MAKILLVEDSFDLTEVITTYLKSQHYVDTFRAESDPSKSLSRTWNSWGGLRARPGLNRGKIGRRKVFLNSEPKVRLFFVSKRHCQIPLLRQYVLKLR